MKPLSGGEIDELCELASSYHLTYSRDDLVRAVGNGIKPAPLRVTVEATRIEVSTPTAYFSLERFE